MKKMKKYQQPRLVKWDMNRKEGPISIEEHKELGSYLKKVHKRLSKIISHNPRKFKLIPTHEEKVQSQISKVISNLEEMMFKDHPTIGKDKKELHMYYY